MNDPHQALTQLAETLLQDPAMLDRLCDRIYDLLLAELSLDQERNPWRP